MGIGSGWWNEPARHALARQGIKTADQAVVAAKISRQSNMGRKLNEMGKMPNRIQNKVQEVSKLLKRVASASPEEARALAAQALVKYNVLKQMMQDYLGQGNEFPDWVKKDWVGRENWNNNGTVYTLLRDLQGESSSNRIIELQRNLAIKVEIKPQKQGELNREQFERLISGVQSLSDEVANDPEIKKKVEEMVEAKRPELEKKVKKLVEDVKEEK